MSWRTYLVLYFCLVGACSSSTLDVLCFLSIVRERGVEHQAYIWFGQLWHYVPPKRHTSIPSMVYRSSATNRALYVVGREIQYKKIVLIIGTVPPSPSHYPSLPPGTIVHCALSRRGYIWRRHCDVKQQAILVDVLVFAMRGKRGHIVRLLYTYRLAFQRTVVTVLRAAEGGEAAL